MRLSALCLVVALAGCGDSTGGPDFSGVQPLDGSYDFSANDLAVPYVYCLQTCNAPDACCIVPTGSGWQAMCSTSCPDGGVFTQCTGPSDCTPQAPSCCVSIALTGDLDAGVMASGGGASCTADCPGGKSADNTVFHTKLCHAATDCAGYSGDFGNGPEPFDGCCLSARARLKFCAPSKYAAPDTYSCN